MADFEAIRAYTLSVFVTDGSSEKENCQSQWCEDLVPSPACCDTRQIHITIGDTNDAPQWPAAAAALKFEVAENSAEGSLVGSGFFATDQDAANTLSYAVVDTTQPLASRLRATTTAVASVTRCQLVVNGSIDFETGATFNVDVVATDAANAQATLSAIEVSVIDVNEPPSVSNFSLSVGENTKKGAFLGNTTSIVISDPEETAPGFARPLFAVDQPAQLGGTRRLIIVSTGIILQQSLDFESVRANPIFSVPFFAVDASEPSIRSNNAYILVTVLDENEPPVVAPVSFTIPEFVLGAGGVTNSGSVVGTVAATDPDDNIANYSFINPSTVFNISDAGKIAVRAGDAAVAQVNFEQDPRRTFSIRVADEDNLFADASVEVNLEDMNDPPVINTASQLSDPTSWLSVSKHTTDSASKFDEFNKVGRIVATLSGSDEDDSATPNGNISFSIVDEYLPHDASDAVPTLQTFAISSEGTITVATLSTGLQTSGSLFRVAVRLRDQGTPAKEDVKDFYINVTAINFKPVMDNEVATLQEGTQTGASVAVMSASDPELTSIVYSITNMLPDLRTYEGERAFELATLGSGSITVTPGFVLDFETTKWFAFDRGVVVISVQAVDAGGATATAICTVTITDVNEPPTLALPPGGLRVREDASAGDPVGAPFSGSDQDASDTPNAGKLVYALASTDTFQLHATTGVLTVKSGATIDFEQLSNYDLVVTVEDTDANKVQTSFRVFVSDVNEPPSVPNQTVSVPESSPPGATVARIDVSDPDRSAMTALTISVDEVVPPNVNFSTAQFSLTSAYLRHEQALDFESTESFRVRVTTNDHGADFNFADQPSTSLTAHAFVSVQVMDVNDLAIEDVVLVSGGREHHTGGGQRVRLSGANMGPKRSSSESVRVFYGPSQDSRRFEAAACTFVEPFGYRIQCDTVPGFGAGLLWTAVIGAFNATCVSASTSYTRPSITSIENAVALSTAGGDVVRILGRNFGPKSIAATISGLNVAYGNNLELQDGSGRVAQSCSVISDASYAAQNITCVSVSGSGTGLSWRVSFPSQSSLPFVDAASGYEKPIITGLSMVTSGARPSSLSTLGNERLRLVGKGFGKVDTVSIKVAYGTYVAQDCVVVEDHVMVECNTVPGVGDNMTVTVSIGPFGFPLFIATTSAPTTNRSLEMSYRNPVLSEVSGPAIFSAATNGDDSVVLRGQGFGPGVRCNSNCRATSICNNGNGMSPTVTYGPKGSSISRYTARCCEVLGAKSRRSNK